MNNAIYKFKEPQNEPVLSYLPGSNERKLLEAELERQSNIQVEIPVIIGGKEYKTGNTDTVVMPHKHSHVLATYHKVTPELVKEACEAAVEAKKKWMEISWVERSSIMLKAAQLISTKYRALINAATMLGQSKNVYQAEIDSACEVIDFLRFNCHFAAEIYENQPGLTNDAINRMEYRPLEGFVFTVSPFNFTAIAANLNASPVLMGNTTVWKPATTSLLSSYYLMQIFKEAGLPDGVINFCPGSGALIGDVVFNHPDFAAVHFTGSTGVFNGMWQTTGNNLTKYKSYPKLVGETGGKDFVFAHSSAKVDELAVGLVRGAFEYQGQKCSAASRAYVPASLWPETKKLIGEMLADIKMGDVRDFNNFHNAVIDRASYNNIMGYIGKAKEAIDAEIIFGGNGDDSVGYFVEPTVVLTTNPHFVTMEEEIFGPVLTIYVYEDDKFEETLDICDNTSEYALTGSIFVNDAYARDLACTKLRYSAGNFYFNDKPSGAVVGMQPFGGARGSGTNDKAGSSLNLLRWISPRTIKETLVPPTEYKYGYME